LEFLFIKDLSYLLCWSVSLVYLGVIVSGINLNIYIFSLSAFDIDPVSFFSISNKEFYYIDPVSSPVKLSLFH
jgi:hypothetical protein